MQDADGGRTSVANIDWSDPNDSACLADVANELLIYLPRTTEGLRETFTAITAALLQQIDGLKAPSWPPAVIDAHPDCREMTLSCFRRALQILRSVLCWKDVLGESLTQDVIHERLLQGKIIPIVSAAAGFDKTLASAMMRSLAVSTPSEYRRIKSLSDLSSQLGCESPDCE